MKPRCTVQFFFSALAICALILSIAPKSSAAKTAPKKTPTTRKATTQPTSSKKSVESLFRKLIIKSGRWRPFFPDDHTKHNKKPPRVTKKPFHQTPAGQKILQKIKSHPFKKVLPVWIKLLKHPSPQLRKLANKSLQDYGIKAAPGLLNALRSPNWKVRQLVESFLLQHHTRFLPYFRKTLLTGNLSTKTISVDLLGKLGKKAHPAIPELVRLVKADANFIEDVVTALVKIGPKTLPHFLQLIAHKNTRLRAMSCQALGQLGQSTKPVMQALQKALKDIQPQVRQKALVSSSTFGIRSRTLQKEIEAALGDKHPSVRSAAVIAFGSLLPKDLSALEKALWDNSTLVRSAGLQALGKLGSRAQKTLPSLEKMLKLEQNPRLRPTILQTFAKVDPSGKKAIPLLSKYIAHRDVRLRWVAVQTLGQFGSKALPILQKVITGTDLSLQEAAAHALGQLGPKALPALVKGLQSKRALTRWAVLNSISRLGEKSASALPQLVKLMDDPTDYIRRSAIRAVGQTGYHANKYISVLRKKWFVAPDIEKSLLTGAMQKIQQSTKARQKRLRAQKASKHPTPRPSGKKK